MPTRIGRTRLKPRKAPRQPRSADTVAAIVEAAARILETRGLDGFNTNAVAERAGVSVGSLYQYFPGKEALIAALSARERGRLAAEIASAARPAAGQTLPGALRHLARVAIQRQLDRPALARVLDFEEQRLVLDDGDRAVTGSMAGEIARLLAVHRRDIEVDDLEEAAFDVIAIARGLIDGAASRGPVERGPLEDRVTRAVLGYLGSRATVGR
jgi:AcrR family transcriptional regulator